MNDYLNSDTLGALYPECEFGENVKIHKSVKLGTNCIIGAGTVILANCYIGSNCYIRANCYIGSNCYIRANCYIGSNCYIGENCIVHSGCIIYSDCRIGQACIIGQDCRVNSGVIIEEGCKIHPGSMFKNNCIIKNNYTGIVIYGLYKCECGHYFDFNDNEIIIRLGCYHRTIKEWDSDFDNNIKEFPLGSEALQKRIEAYEFCKNHALKVYKSIIKV